MSKGRFNRGDDFLSDLILKLKDIVQHPIEAIGPQMATVLCIYQLPCYSKALTCASDRSLKHVSDTEQLSDFANIRTLSLERER